MRRMSFTREKTKIERSTLMNRTGSRLQRFKESMMREKEQRSHLALAKGKWARQCALLRAIKQVSRKTRPIELAACGCVGSPSSFWRSKTGRGLRRLHFLAEKALILAWICISGYRSVWLGTAWYTGHTAIAVDAGHRQT